jgi:nucleotidyltransferase substrate binding protein (TIGR01987 family)
MPELNLEPLEQAVAQLERGLAQTEADPGNELERDGVIQRFEYTMDLAGKLLQRYLRVVAEVPESSLRTKKDLFREGARLGLPASAEPWIGHYEARNETAHSHSGATAALVFTRARAFLPDDRTLLEALRRAA